MCGDVQVEHVIARTCLSACKVTRLLRVHGESLVKAENAMDSLDKVKRGTLDRLFAGFDDGHTQAGLSGGVGGLGFRHVSKVALPAAIASRIMARPKVAYLARSLNTACIVPYTRGCCTSMMLLRRRRWQL